MHKALLNQNFFPYSPVDIQVSVPSFLYLRLLKFSFIVFRGIDNLHYPILRILQLPPYFSLRIYGLYPKRALWIITAGGVYVKNIVYFRVKGKHFLTKTFALETASGRIQKRDSFNTIFQSNFPFFN
jgi:hypothetical protein